MKHSLLLLMIALSIFACKKETIPSNNLYLENVKQGLRDSLARQDFQRLDFKGAILSKVDSVGLYLFRVPFHGSSIGVDFVIVKTGRDGKIEQGRIVHHKGNLITYGEGRVKSHRWDGSITISSLDRSEVIQSPIVNGFITAFHSNINARSSVHEAGLMPEVVITYVIPSAGSNFSWSTWMSFVSFFSQTSANESLGGYYSWFDGGGSPGGSGGGSTGGSGNPITGGGSVIDEPIQIDFETVLDKPEIDLQRFINCFNAIPDAGATCSIELFADIPVDKDPNKIFNFETQSPGHTFIQIKKSNGAQSAVQNIGFYPMTDWKSIFTNAPIDGKFVDNGEHEFNVSFMMTLTPAQLQSVLTQLLYLKNVKYDIDNYNCTDWALDVFNKVRTDKLTIPLYDIPGNVPSLGTRTPNGVYNKLREMKTSGHAEAANINYNFMKGYVARSTGPCN